MEAGDQPPPLSQSHLTPDGAEEIPDGQVPPQYEEGLNDSLYMLGIGPDDSEAFKLFKVMMVDIWSVLVSIVHK